MVALRDLEQGESIKEANTTLVLLDPVKAKHKIAVDEIKLGEKAFMYGVLVGEATRTIRRGEKITINNLVHRSSPYQNTTRTNGWQSPPVSQWSDKNFLGYKRKDGKVGTANIWLVVPMVFCENGNIEILNRSINKALGFDKRSQYETFADELAGAYRSGDSPQSISLPNEKIHRPSPIFPNVDGVKFLTHGLGCGETRGISNELCGLLAGYACNPNVAGITILSLGCQHAQVSILEDEIAKRCPDFDKPFLVFEQQKYRSEREMLEKAIRQTFENLEKVNQLERTPSPLSKLCLGMECGASDGFSGISANPCIGQVADMTVGLGGRVILSEFPELCGVEHRRSEIGLSKS